MRMMIGGGCLEYVRQYIFERFDWGFIHNITSLTKNWFCYDAHFKQRLCMIYLSLKLKLSRKHGS